MTNDKTNNIRLVILDLDGTLLATEHAVSRAASDVLASHGVPALPAEAAAAALGRRPLEAWKAVVDVLRRRRREGEKDPPLLSPEVTAEQLLRESEERLVEGWKDVSPLPGAKRLVAHLKSISNGIGDDDDDDDGGGNDDDDDGNDGNTNNRRRKRKKKLLVALVTSTPAATLARKTGPGSRGEAFGRETWDVVVCGDDVGEGKPHPEGLLLAAARASELLLMMKKEGGEEEEEKEGGGGESGNGNKILPSECLVIEDSPAGAEAAVAAGMNLVVVPSLREKKKKKKREGNEEEGEEEQKPLFPPSAVSLPTLLAFDPTLFGLPPFPDARALAGGRAIQLDPLLKLEGRVVRGFGRGSSQLGIPTANLDGAALAKSLDGAVTGIFAAFARVFLEPPSPSSASPEIYPAVLSCGYNPQFDDGVEQRTCEPWILSPPGALPKCFRGARMKLLVVSYIRPEAKFVSVEKLIEQIHDDAEVAKVALRELEGLKEDPWLVSDE